MLTAPDRSVEWSSITAERRADLVRFARSRIGNGQAGGYDAEDVVQEVLLRILDRDGENQHSAQRSATVVRQPVAYLRRAVANECVTRWRRYRREIPTDTPPDHLQRDHAEPCATRITVRSALTTLTKRQQEVLTRSFLLDLADNDIAADLGISPVTVRTLRHRGLVHLRGLLTAPPNATQASPASYQRPSDPPLRIIA